MMVLGGVVAGVVTVTDQGREADDDVVEVLEEGLMEQSDTQSKELVFSRYHPKKVHRPRRAPPPTPRARARSGACVGRVGCVQS